MRKGETQEVLLKRFIREVLIRRFTKKEVANNLPFSNGEDFHEVLEYIYNNKPSAIEIMDEYPTSGEYDKYTINEVLFSCHTTPMTLFDYKLKVITFIVNTFEKIQGQGVATYKLLYDVLAIMYREEFDINPLGATKNFLNRFTSICKQSKHRKYTTFFSHLVKDFKNVNLTCSHKYRCRFINTGERNVSRNTMMLILVNAIPVNKLNEAMKENVLLYNYVYSIYYGQFRTSPLNYDDSFLFNRFTLFNSLRLAEKYINSTLNRENIFKEYTLGGIKRVSPKVLKAYDKKCVEVIEDIMHMYRNFDDIRDTLHNVVDTSITVKHLMDNLISDLDYSSRQLSITTNMLIKNKISELNQHDLLMEVCLWYKICVLGLRKNKKEDFCILKDKDL